MKLFVIALVPALVASPALAGESGPATSRGEDPNAKVCQTVVPLGSRLNAKRVCATRAEWAEKRKRDREMIDKAQQQIRVVNPGD